MSCIIVFIILVIIVDRHILYYYRYSIRSVRRGHKVLYKTIVINRAQYNIIFL